LALHAQHAAAVDEHARTSLARRVLATQKNADEIVADLYRLSLDELELLLH
jgi:hypothetical protein